MDVKLKMTLPWLMVAALVALPAQGSLVEQTVTSVAGENAECIQNDGPSDDGMECDASDVCEGAYHQVETMSGERTPGQLVPVDDETDFFLVDFSGFQGSRMRLDVAGVSMEYSVALYSDGCEALAGAGVDAPAAAAASAPVQAVFSGVKPFQPINADLVSLDGAPVAAYDGVAAADQLVFRIMNTPKHLTFGDVVYALDVGQSILLCGFAGDLRVTVGASGGNIKFDGVATDFQLRDPGVAFAACPGPSEPAADPQCGAHYCEVTINSSTTHVRMMVHFDALDTEPDPIVIPASCHDFCLPLPNTGMVPGAFSMGSTQRDSA